MASFSPVPAASQAPLPPLPDLSAGPKGGAGAASTSPPSFLASIMSGIAPVKNSVDTIQAECRKIVQSKAVPGSEQICSQIVALAQSLVPMAAQNALQPGMTGGAQAPASAPAMPPPPGPPPPMQGAPVPQGQ